jgi:hypothetical protein
MDQAVVSDPFDMSLGGARDVGRNCQDLWMKIL